MKDFFIFLLIILTSIPFFYILNEAIEFFVDLSLEWLALPSFILIGFLWIYLALFIASFR